MQFLISSYWVIDEAARLNVRVSSRSVRTKLASLEDQEFKTTAALDEWLAKNGETEADLLFRVRIDMLGARINHVATKFEGIGRFLHRFAARWRSQTSCAPAYMNSDCARSW